MGNINKVFLMGNLTRDPELRKTASGLAVSDLGLAVNERHRNKSGELVESVCFADVVVWGRQAENCDQYLEKGSSVIVEGRLQLDQWKTPSGEKRSRLRVRADRVQFMGRARRANPAHTEHRDADPFADPVPAEEGTQPGVAPF